MDKPRAIAKRVRKRLPRPFGQRELVRQDILRILKRTPDRNQAASVLADWFDHTFRKYLSDMRAVIREELAQFVTTMGVECEKALDRKGEEFRRTVEEAKADLERRADEVDGEGWKHGRQEEA